jgi:hypothetical protein
MTLRTCPAAGCTRALQCQRARDHRRNPVAEEFDLAPFVEESRVLYTDGRRAEIKDQQCEWFIEWRQQ